MRTKTKGALHLTTGFGPDARILCGTAKRFTYRDIAQDTHTRMMASEFFGPRHPEWGTESVCADCLVEFEG